MYPERDERIHTFQERKLYKLTNTITQTVDDDDEEQQRILAKDRTSKY